MRMNYEYRANARAIMKVHLAPAVLVALLASLPSLLAQVVTALGASGMQKVLDEAVMKIYTGELVDPTALFRSLAATITPVTIGAIVLTVLAFLLLPFLNLGFLNYLLKLVRGEETDISDVFSRKSLFVKGILQTLLRLLKILLWELPGMAVMIVGMMLGLQLKNIGIVNTALSVGMILSMVLVIRAMVSYYFAEYLLADKPETTVRLSFRHSVDLIRPRMGQVMMMLIMFLAWMMAINFVSEFAANISVLFGSMLSMVLQLVLNVYMGLSIAGMYDDIANGRFEKMDASESQQMNDWN